MPPESSIRSERLDLVSMTPAVLRACLSGRFSEASRLLGMKVPDDWAVHEAPLEMRLQQLEADPGLQPWLLRAISLRSTGEMIGFAGFHTAPAPEYLQRWLPGGIEFGFTIFPMFRGNGYARETAAALMRWAQESHGVSGFVLTISPTNAASQAIASRLGFVRIGEHVDETDGVEDVLALRNVGVASLALR